MASDSPGHTFDLRRLPLRAKHAALGARFVPFAGWEMPLQYVGIVGEHEAVRGRAGVFDVSHLGRVVLSTPGATALLRRATTYAVDRIREGFGHYSLYCNTAGGIEDDIFLYRLGAENWLIVHNAANANADFARLDELSGGVARDITAETVMLAVQGPNALPALRQVFGPALDVFAQHACGELSWRGARVLIARTGYTGEDGAECVLDVDAAGALWDELTGLGIEPAGIGARDTLRLEAALPLHGNDIDPTTNPFEAGLGWAVSLDDGANFIGRRALADLKERPLTRQLAHVCTRERAVLRAGYPVVGPGDESAEALATLTSGSFSPTLRLGIGMTYLPPQLAVRGTGLEVQVRDSRIPVDVVARPFYRRKEHG